MIRGPLRLFAYSALMLFTELALIRWLGSNVFYLSFFSNFVLLGSFLGIGLGFLRARAGRDLSPYLPLGLALLIAAVVAVPVQVQRSSDDLIFFGNGATTTGLPDWLILPFIFLAVAAVMEMIGEGVARAFIEYEPLRAYRLDILGSLAGIVAFSVLSWLWAPPLAWGIVVSVLIAALLGRRLRFIGVVALGLLLVALGRESLDPANSWSPYYKVTLVQRGPAVQVYVNGIPHQTVEDPVRDPTGSQVFRQWPYADTSTTPNTVLIVGAGNGNDVAVALARGAQHVDAVEIDPRLLQIGQQLHPDRPYQDPRVTAHVDDGRAFLEHTTQQYDLIIFALPDSLTLVSGQSSLRLESYLFTQEALQTARNHLRPGGSFSMYNSYRELWLVDRLGQTLSDVYQAPPCLRRVGVGTGLSVLTDSVGGAGLHCGTGVWSQLSDAVPAPTTDDYPFLYLRTPTIPALYLVTLLPIALLSLLLVRVTGGPLRAMTRHLDLFFMGAAFLLLETKSVVQFSLLFGTTWFVNALVFIGVLLAVYVAIEISQRWEPAHPTLLYGILLLSLAIAWLVPLHALLGWDTAARFIGAAALTFTPILLANLIFAQTFKNVGEASSLAFGANLLGAMVGGILEYSALLFGYRALLILVAVLYLCSLLAARLLRGARASGVRSPV